MSYENDETWTREDQDGWEIETSEWSQADWELYREHQREREDNDRD